MNQPDQIFLEGVQFFGFHGFHAEEQRLGQRFVVDLTIDTSTRSARFSDDLPDTVSYSRLYAIARDIVEGPAKRLIRAVARVALAILCESNQT